MGEQSGPFKLNQQDIAAKVIDGELIIIRLSDGTYYSMDNVGARAWELIEARYDFPALAKTISGWYDVPVDRVEDDLGPLVRELLSERLIVAAAPDMAAPAEAAPTDEVLEYEAPRLNIHRDMGNLLALDPPTPGIDDLLFRDEKTD